LTRTRVDEDRLRSDGEPNEGENLKIWLGRSVRRIAFFKSSKADAENERMISAELDARSSSDDGNKSSAYLEEALATRLI